MRVVKDFQGMLMPELTLEVVCQWKRNERVTYYFLFGLICLLSFLPSFTFCSFRMLGAFFSPSLSHSLRQFRGQGPFGWFCCCLSVLSSGRDLLSSFFCSRYISYLSMASLFTLTFFLLCPYRYRPPARLFLPSMVLWTNFLSFSV